MNQDRFKDIPHTLLQHETLLTLEEPVMVYQADDGKSINVVYALHGKVVDKNGQVASLTHDDDDFSPPPPPKVHAAKETLFKDKAKRTYGPRNESRRNGGPVETYRTA